MELNSQKFAEEGNLELEKQLKQSNLNRDALASAHSKIAMGAKRKNELEDSLKPVESKRKKLTLEYILIKEFARFLDY